MGSHRIRIIIGNRRTFDNYLDRKDLFQCVPGAGGGEIKWTRSTGTDNYYSGLAAQLY
jgi:hypothetical protein